MPLNELISPILIGAGCAAAGVVAARTRTAASRSRAQCRLMRRLPVVRLTVGPTHSPLPPRRSGRDALHGADRPDDGAATVARERHAQVELGPAAVLLPERRPVAPDPRLGAEP